MNINELPITNISSMTYLSDTAKRNEFEIWNKFIEPLCENLIQHYAENETVEMILPVFNLRPDYPYLNFGIKKTNNNYCEKELKWYLSQDLSIKGWVDDIAIWNKCCTQDDRKLINSNYGYLVFSEENGDQFKNCLNKLIEDPHTRNAIIQYQRPEIYTDMSKDGMHDMICTQYSHFLIRNNELVMVHNMRSNDFIFGFFNDFVWNCFVYQNMYEMLKNTYPNLKMGNIVWSSNSMHVYKRHWPLLRDIYNKVKNQGL